MTINFFNGDSVTLVILIILVSLPIFRSEVTRDELQRNREKRLFNVFQIVRFPNDPCIATGSRNGTCYTEDECQSKSGVGGGSCASGFGVCCVFNRGCGSMSNENCTFFEVGSGSVQAGPCALEVCRCNSNVCQLRLDFNTFVISGPSTSTVVVATLLNGLPSGMDELDNNGNLQAIQASLSTRCLTDTFSVTNPGGHTPPVICGTNTGEHMYVESSEECNVLDFKFGTAANTANRQFTIKVTQISCDSELLPPMGCTQYFYGSTTDTVQTYNFDNGNGLHLANQDQNICVRQERGNCRICWSATDPTDFRVSGNTAEVGVKIQENCCRYGTNGLNTQGYDCIIIPGAGIRSRICGRNNGLVQSNNQIAVTICTTKTPFMVRFNSDNFEYTGPMNVNPVTREASGASTDIGFRVAFIQDNTNCFTSQ